MSRIGRYEVETEIGRGAMGVVYLAQDPRLLRRVAIKVHRLPDGLSAEQDREYRERFLREAQAAAVLSHPGIVTVYDADEDTTRGLPYIAMEYIEGQSLRQILDENGKLEPETTQNLGVALAKALQVAHDAGIVHRDVKPANVLVRDDDGEIKIADFGVARLATSELTRSGSSLGSPAYMSPEQIRGVPLDGRSDLFSLAAILYEALCGSRPFGGEDTAALVYAIVHETPIPITKRRPGLPRALDRFFDKALAKDPRERFESGEAFALELGRAFQDDRTEDPESTVVNGAAIELQRTPDAPPIDWTSDRDYMPLAGPERGDVGPLRRRMLVAAAAALVLFVGGWAIFGGKNEAYLRLDAKNNVEAGQLSLMIDGEEVYSRALSAPPQKKNLVKKLIDQKAETFEAWIEVPPGKHEIVAQVIPEGRSTGYRDTVVVDLEPGETRRLRLVAGRAYGSALTLKVN